MLFFNKLTDTSLIPGSLPTLFSILAEQAEQVMPVMSNCSFAKSSLLSQLYFCAAVPLPRGELKTVMKRGFRYLGGKMPPPRSQSLRARSLTIFHYRHCLNCLSAPIGRFSNPISLILKNQMVNVCENVWPLNPKSNQQVL